jgi:polysaccharide biosynthesis/export protein
MEARMGGVIRHLCRTALLHDRNRFTDGQLLDRFLARREEAAFEALVQRHGPMVLGVCQRVLHNAHDAEDAFQATFLVLVRKAASIVPRERVGNWLYGVAHRTALKARGEAARRRAREQQVKDVPRREPAEEFWWELRPLLDAELHRLPDNYRAAVVLCDLEGKSRKEAARQLGWAEGTLSGRLARARGLLAKRLARHGLALTAGALAMALTERARAMVPATLAVFTVKAALLTAAGQAAAAGVVPAKVAALTEGVLRAMMMTKLKAAAAVVLLLAGIGIGAGTLARQTWAADGPERGERAAAPSEPTPALPAYVIEPPDVLRVEYPFDATTGIVLHLVRPDGSIDFGPRGEVMVAGLTVEQAKQAIARHLAKKLDDFRGNKLKVEVAAFNSKVFYVLTDFPGPGDQVYRFPCTGKETVLYALAQVDGLPRVAGKKHVWISRRSEAAGGTDRILTVDWLAIIRDGTTATNYPLRAGDRVHVKDEAPMTTEVQAGKADTVPSSPATAPRVAVPSTDVGMLQAEKDFKVAEFFRRGGQHASALFYYELVCRRYPDTAVAERASARLRELRKEAADYAADLEKAARGVQIYIVGNADKQGSLILSGPALGPGADLNYAALSHSNQVDLEVMESQLVAYAVQFRRHFENFRTGRGTLDIYLEAQRFWAQALAQTSATDVAFVRTRSFRIPFQVAQPPRGLKQLVLFVSEDEGRTYRQAASAAPDESSFRFEAPHDGTYCFVVQTVAADRIEPGDVTAAKPVLRVRVETKVTPARVGQIHIVGNTKTEDAVILQQLGLLPGAALGYRDLQAAEKKLAQLGRFVVDPDKGVRPTVTVVDADGDSRFKDILVQVQEKEEIAAPASVDDMLEVAFGKECPERDYAIKVQIHSRGMVLAAKELAIEKDGRVRLAPVSAAIFGKTNNDGKVPEINTVRANVARLTFDPPIAHPADMAKHKLVAFVVDSGGASPFKDILVQVQEKEAAAAPLINGLGSDVAFINARSFRIPFQLSDTARNVKEVVLFVSEDEGRTYRQAATATPQEKSFRFNAPRDGVYCFVVQAITGYGKEPADVAGAKPLCRVCVDTQAPVAKLTPESLLTGRAIGWEVSDDNLDLSTLRLDYQVVGETEWRSLPVKPAATGEIDWQPPADAAVKVRLRVSDKAGNQASVSAILKPGKPE